MRKTFHKLCYTILGIHFHLILIFSRVWHGQKANLDHSAAIDNKGEFMLPLAEKSFKIITVQNNC